jgi:N-acetylglutamate synthase-like GNAT family acetyltransferase
MDIHIRTATLDDVPALQQLIPLSARELSKNYYTRQQIDSANKFIFGVDTQLIADQTYYVAQAAEQIVGCGGWSKRKTLFGGDQMKDMADPMLDPKTDAGRIRAFFVHPDWARKGIGRRLIRTCEDAARAEGFSLMELASTLPGEPLYSAMGYQVSQRVEHPMPDGTSLPLAYMHKLLNVMQDKDNGKKQDKAWYPDSRMHT